LIPSISSKWRTW